MLCVRGGIAKAGNNMCTPTYPLLKQATSEDPPREGLISAKLVSERTPENYQRQRGESQLVLLAPGACYLGRARACPKIKPTSLAGRRNFFSPLNSRSEV